MVSSKGQPVEIRKKGRKFLFQIRDWEQDGISGREMLRRLRDDGLQISDKDFWNTRRLARGMRESARKFRNQKKDKVRDEKLIPVAPFEFTRGRIQYLVQIIGRKSESNELVDDEYVTVSSSKPLSRAEVERQAERLLRLGVEAYGIDLNQRVRFRVVEVWRNG